MALLACAKNNTNPWSSKKTVKWSPEGAHLSVNHSVWGFPTAKLFMPLKSGLKKLNFSLAFERGNWKGQECEGARSSLKNEGLGRLSSWLLFHLLFKHLDQEMQSKVNIESGRWNRWGKQLHNMHKKPSKPPVLSFWVSEAQRVSGTQASSAEHTAQPRRARPLCTLSHCPVGMQALCGQSFGFVREIFESWIFLLQVFHFLNITGSRRGFESVGGLECI